MKMNALLIYFFVCILLISSDQCLGFSLLAPRTNQIICLNAHTGEIVWKTRIPLKADSVVDICGGLARVTPALADTEFKRAVFLDKKNGQLKHAEDWGSTAPTGRRYTVTGKMDTFFKEQLRLAERIPIDGNLNFIDDDGTIKWAISRPGIVDSVVASDNLLLVGSHEWKPARRPIDRVHFSGPLGVLVLGLG